MTSAYVCSSRSTTASSASSRDTASCTNWIGSAYRQRYANIQRLYRILEAENDDVNLYKASKQADALMLLYLMSSDELVSCSSGSATASLHEQIPEIVDYYMARTSHGSTLSGVVHTWCWPGQP